MGNSCLKKTSRVYFLMYHFRLDVKGKRIELYCCITELPPFFKKSSNFSDTLIHKGRKFLDVSILLLTIIAPQPNRRSVTELNRHLFWNILRCRHDIFFREMIDFFKRISGVFLLLLFKFRCTYRFKIEIHIMKGRIHCDLVIFALEVFAFLIFGVPLLSKCFC